MEPQINTTPRRREPPSKLISAARREIPNIMSGIHPDGDPDGTVHGNVIVVMIAGVLAAKIRDIGHGIAAAEWGIHHLRWPFTCMAAIQGSANTGRNPPPLPYGL
jgi:hypothetical protein